MSAMAVSKLAFKYRCTILLVLTLVIIIYRFLQMKCLVSSLCSNCKPNLQGRNWTKNGFTNYVEGVKYKTDNQTILKEYRPLALEVVARIMKSAGREYTPLQLTSIPDSVLIPILEQDGDGNEKIAIERVVLMTDPSYKDAYAAVDYAMRTRKTSLPSANRELVLALYEKYLRAVDVDIRARMILLSNAGWPPENTQAGKIRLTNLNPSQWSDKLLMRCFKTMKLPEKREIKWFYDTTSSGVVNTSSTQTTTPRPNFTWIDPRKRDAEWY